MSTRDNPLGDRGKAMEDKWAREQDALAIEKMRKQGQGDATTGDGKTCGCKKTDGDKKCACKGKSDGSSGCACGGNCAK